MTRREGAGSSGAHCIGVDVGGTYTDVVVLRPEGWTTVKRLSTPSDPSRAVIEVLESVDPRRGSPVVHGTTVATNTLLERNGARTAFVTTAGFGDLLALGRGARRDLYALEPRPTVNLVPPHLCFEVGERLDARGDVARPLDAAALATLAGRVAEAGIEAVAVCLLFSYLNDSHERAVVAELVRASDARTFVCCSFDVLPELREYERASTTVVNAYVAPRMVRYLTSLGAAAAPRPLTVMASHGGRMPPAIAAQLPAATALSGPAGGVLGALAVALRAGMGRIITCDMGGTSTDVSLADGAVPFTGAAQVGGVPVHLPTVDIQTIGAGGGSLLWADEAGALRVGPLSAGAEPGPACYGRGGRGATLTDAHVVLGRLPAVALAGGSLALDACAARDALGPLAAKLGTSVEAVALAALAVADAAMARAIRSVSVQRGYDPAGFTLVAFGGAGPLHACTLAEAIGTSRVLLPAVPGALAALGLATAEPVITASQSLLRRDPRPVDVDPAYLVLEARARARLGQEVCSVERLADARYEGQSWELTVPWPPDGRIDRAFEASHERHFGYVRSGKPVELVTLRVRVRGRPLAALPSPPPLVPPDERSAMVYLDANAAQPMLVRSRFSLAPGEGLLGPAILTQPDTTVFVAPGWQAVVGEWGDLVLRLLPGAAEAASERAERPAVQPSA